MATPEDLATAGLRTIANSAGRGAALDLGATVTSWQPHGQSDVLFLSREARAAAGDEIHGGIPICAPWFGQGRDGVDVPRPHGLARWVPWHLVSEQVEEDATTLVWQLGGADIAHLPGAKDYPSDISFRHEVRFGRTLTVSLTVGSPTTSFVLDGAFHTYFAVSDIHDVVIDGLGGARYRDYTDDARWHESAGGLRIPGRTDRIYDRTGEVTITDAARVLTLRTQGGANTVVWNPGPEGGKSLRGWAGDEWTRMVCVEVGNVAHNAVTVPTCCSHTLTLEIESRPIPRRGRPIS